MQNYKIATLPADHFKRLKIMSFISAFPNYFEKLASTI